MNDDQLEDLQYEDLEDIQEDEIYDELCDRFYNYEPISQVERRRVCDFIYDLADNAKNESLRDVYMDFARQMMGGD